MNANHTPGPWSVFKTPYKGHASAAFYIFGATTDCRSPAVAHIKRSTVQPMEANARLIAAAPELLAAAQSFIELYEAFEILVGSENGSTSRVHCALDAARAAIAKATGA